MVFFPSAFVGARLERLVVTSGVRQCVRPEIGATLWTVAVHQIPISDLGTGKVLRAV
jgi:hypothetical protein